MNTSSQTIKRVFLFDYDGPCVRPGMLNLDSLVLTGNGLLEDMHKCPFTEEMWAEILKETSGTTELYTINVIAHKAGLTEQEVTRRGGFKDLFLACRAKFHELALRAEGIDKEDLDYVHPDVLFFIKNALNKDDLVWLVTGNPLQTMRQRLKFTPELQEIFAPNGFPVGVFGEEALTRQELIQIALNRATQIGFNCFYDEMGWIENVFYIGDAPKDFEAAFHSRIRHIYIPRVPYDYLPEGNQSPSARLASQIKLSDYADNVEQGIATFFRNGPRMYYPGSFYNPFLMDFINPNLHSYEKLRLRQIYIQEIEKDFEGIYETDKLESTITEEENIK